MHTDPFEGCNVVSINDGYDSRNMVLIFSPKRLTHRHLRRLTRSTTYNDDCTRSLRAHVRKSAINYIRSPNEFDLHLTSESSSSVK
jgi:hypothetical protein